MPIAKRGSKACVSRYPTPLRGSGGSLDASDILVKVLFCVLALLHCLLIQQGEFLIAHSSSSDSSKELHRDSKEEIGREGEIGTERESE